MEGAAREETEISKGTRKTTDLIGMGCFKEILLEKELEAIWMKWDGCVTKG